MRPWNHDSLRTLINTQAHELDAFLARQRLALADAIRTTLVLPDGNPGPVPVPRRGRLLIPLYDYPSAEALSDSWAKVSKIGKAGVVIVNPSNGDFPSADGNYLKGIEMLDAGGVDWIGYVSTDYGKRPITDIINDIQTWPKVYPSCKGFFFDEQQRGWNQMYSQIAAAARVAIQGALLVSNPGVTGSDPKYLEVFDVLVMAEKSLSAVPKLPAWAESASDDKIALLAHGVTSPTQMRSLVTQANAMGYGMIYVTDRQLGQDLWGDVPTYWTDLLAAAADSNPGYAPGGPNAPGYPNAPGGPSYPTGGGGGSGYPTAPGNPPAPPPTGRTR